MISRAAPMAACIWLWLILPFVTGYSARALILAAAIAATGCAIYSIGAALGAWKEES